VALALEKSLKLRDPSIESQVINFFDTMPAWLVRTIDGAYYKMIEKKPGLWAFLRKSPLLGRLVHPLKELFVVAMTLKFRRSVLQSFKPDLIAFRSSLFCGTLFLLLRRSYQDFASLPSPSRGILFFPPESLS